MSLLIKGATLVDPANGVNGRFDLVVADGRVAAVGENMDVSTAKTIDAGGLHLFPGLIDVHVHLREPGYEYKEDIGSGTRAAAAGGFTAVAAMPNTSPPNDDASVTRYILEMAEQAGVCRVYPVGAISKGQKGEDLADMGDLKEAGCVAVTDDGWPVDSPILMRKAMEYAKSFGLTVISHSEVTELAAGCVNEGLTSTLLGLPAIPAEAEEIMVIRDILLARRTGAKLHLAHLSTAGSMEFLRWGKAAGINVTGETAPHYFTLTDEVVRTYDARFKMNPPLRGDADRDASILALADGTVDAIATDHAPHGDDEKLVEFEAAPNGVIGLETSLGLGLILVDSGKLTLGRLVEAMTCGPARALNLEGGALGVGDRADMTLVDLSAETVVDTDKFESKASNCPFAGMTLKGRVVRTMVEGRTVYADGEIIAANLAKAEY